ncbi:hypothetical protein [Ciceribacter sp. T2.26MG-112.2]|jgi:hypothetical protein|uniref:hypothetical protein n=1 Tax=Ciceribacter sp. T2.26MG-112.2 TaxID=3137154 RepID=UPI000E11AA4E|nr:hypothetical protein [Ciceribacter naphthalenivorans]MBU0835493.1 hypothetical protein [Alphaproteobacteria bacterium]MDI6834111.1 hypothetical protein [Rhizobiaceae bacterium]SSX47209.1 unnamed protein product [Ciceribacter naphthalenivorans]
MVKQTAIFSLMKERGRFTSALLLTFRLVILVSLAGYSLSTVNAAMHPESPFNEMQVEAGHPASHKGGPAALSDMSVHSDHHERGESKVADKNCCQEFCVVAAIECDAAGLLHLIPGRVSGSREDALYLGVAPRVTLPPNI